MPVQMVYHKRTEDLNDLATFPEQCRDIRDIKLFIYVVNSLEVPEGAN